MSITKNYLDKEQAYYKIAYDILIEIGAIKECEFHSDYYYDTSIFEEKVLYGICTNKLKEKYGETQDFEIFHSQISEIIRNAAIESSCPYCEKD